MTSQKWLRAPTLSASGRDCGEGRERLPVKTVVVKNRVSNPAASPPSTSPALAPGQQKESERQTATDAFLPVAGSTGPLHPSKVPAQMVFNSSSETRSKGRRDRASSEGAPALPPRPLDEGSDGDEADLALAPSQSEHVALAPLRGREAEWERKKLAPTAWFRLVRQTANDLTAFSVPWRVGVHTPTQQGNGRSKHIEAR